MNLQDHILRAVRAKPLGFDALREAINDEGDPRHPWLEDFFATQLDILQCRGQIVRCGEKFAVPENPAA